MKKILITPRSFAKYNKEEIIQLLIAHGIEAEFNPVGQILSEDQLKEHLFDKDGVILGVDPLTKQVLAKAPHLKAVAKYGVGIDNIDLDYAKEHHIAVSRTVHANSNAVADYTFALLMSVSRRVVEINDGCKNGDWTKKVGLDVYGKKIGVLGLGDIGRGVVKRAKGFGMTVYGYDLYLDADYIKQNEIHFTTIAEIFKECDFITLHLPLTEKTQHLVNAELLATAKENLVLVNTARGGIVDETALYEACLNKEIFGAGIDVFETEPPEHSKLLELDNIVVGSHTAASTVGATEQMSLMAANNIIHDLEGK